MEKISPRKLKKELEKGNIQVIDVREPYEFEDANIGGKNIPMGEVMERQEEIKKDLPVVFCCKSGKRAAAVALSLERKFNHPGVLFLEGGIKAFLNNQ